MSNNIYNILWIDDNHENLAAFKRKAKTRGIELKAFKSLEGGMAELSNNHKDFHGVLLDAYFYKNEDDQIESEIKTHVYRAKERIGDFPEKFHIHIFTGDENLCEDKDFNDIFFDKVYCKLHKEKIDSLFDSIKKSAEEQPAFQLRQKYRRVFEVCHDKYLGSKSYETLIDLFKKVDTIDDFDTTKDYLITIRKIIEKLVEKLVEKNLIPNEIYYGNKEIKGGFNASVKFICNNINRSNFTLVKNYMHPTLAYFFDKLGLMVQDVQHDKKDLRLFVDEYITQIKSPYLFNSLVFQLMDVLIWFKNFIDQNPDPEENKKLWVEIDRIDNNNNISIEGNVINLHPDGFAFFKPKGATSYSDNIHITKSDVLKFKLIKGPSYLFEYISFQDNNSGQTKTQVKNIQLIETTEESSI